MGAGFWCQPARPWNSMKFQAILNTFRNHQNGAWRPPKTSKISQEMPEIIKHMKKSEKWNLMKTILFTMFFKGWDIRNQRFFQSKIIKNRACNPNMFFDASNHRKYQKVIQTGVQRGTPNPSKIVENPAWDLPGSLCVHRWPTWLQHCLKIMPKDLQMDPKWSPGDPKRS